MKAPSNNAIALIAMILAVGLTAYIFAASRNDPGLRMAALVAGTSAGAALLAIASTMLTGKDLTRPDPSQLPPGSISSQTSTVQTPPVEPPKENP